MQKMIKNSMKKFYKNNKGITLISLIVTIVLLIILAGIGIATLTNESSVINQANSAKEKSEIAREKEILELATVKQLRNTNDLQADLLQDELDLELGINKTNVYQSGNSLDVLFNENNRGYSIDNLGEITGPFEKIEDEYAGDITKNNTRTGTNEDSAYIINCIEDLVAFSNMVNTGNTMQNKYVILNRTLDFKSFFSYNNANAKYSYNTITGIYEEDETSLTTIKQLLTTGQGFIPIGIDSTTNYFAGIFDGKGNEIKNIYIDNEALENVGLFGYTKGTIKKLGMVNSQVTGTLNVGSICGMLRTSTGLIQYCYNTGGNILAEDESAGIAGGIVGGISIPYGTGSGSKVLNCYNTGNVVSKKTAGGIVGQAGYQTNINYVYNSGNISGDTAAGGIVGLIDCAQSTSTDKLQYIYNIGNVEETTNNCGALYGQIARLKITTEAYYLKGSCSKPGKIGFGGSISEDMPKEVEEDEMMTLEEFISSYMTY